MTVQHLKETANAVPFIPFKIYYPGGPAVDVPNRDYVSFSPTGRIVTVFLPDERLVRIDVALITSLEELVPAHH